MYRHDENAYMKDLLLYLLNVDTIKNRNKVLINLIAYLNSSNEFGKAAFYLLNHWEQVYQPVESCLSNTETSLLANNIEFKAFIESALQQIHNEDISYQKCGGHIVIAIPLIALNDPKGLILLTYNGEFNDVLQTRIAKLQATVEKVLNILNHYQHLYQKNRGKDFLFEMTSEFNSIATKEEVIKCTLESINRVFPDFSHHLLLSHDHDLDETLPVETIDHSTEGYKKNSDIAFISGNIQIEVNNDHSTINIPLVGKQGIYGVLEVITPKKIVFMEEDKKFLIEFGNIVGKALENITLYINSRNQASELKIINEVAQQLNSNLKKEKILELVKSKILTTCDATEMGFILADEENDGEFKVLDHSSTYFESEEGKALSNYLLTKINKTQEPVILGSQPKGLEYKYNSIMAIPMDYSGEMQGVVIILHEKDNHFTLNRFRLMQSLVQHLTLALKNSLLKEKLEHAVITDYLTKLSTRNFLERKIDSHMENDKTGTLILFDIDNFKNINDQYGHYIGDKVIIQVANLIKANVRRDDVTSRWGGEELAVYMPETDVNGGFELAKRICSLVEKNTTPKVTLSAGVSEWSSLNMNSANELFIHADDAMYEAKSMGKNQAVMK